MPSIMIFKSRNINYNKQLFWKTNKVFVVSSGRTGTKFFGNYLKLFISNSISSHEPDVINFTEKVELRQRLKRQGVIDLFVLKGLGITGVRNLSLKALAGKISNNQIIDRFLYSRRWVQCCDYYFESNAQLFGITKTLSKMPNTKVVIIFRDPRTWVRSWMNKGYWYDNKDKLTQFDFLGLKRLNPKNVFVNLPQWKNFSRFEKLCWTWNYMNNGFYHSLEDDNIKSFKFEDVFIEKNLNTLWKLFYFIFEDSHTENYVNKFLELADKKVNQTVIEKYPHWSKWPKNTCKILHTFCGDLMLKLGYGFEEAWLEKVNG